MRRWALLFLALAAAYAFRMGHRALWDPDEGRYAEIAREMAATGDWLTPRLNGVVYLEKPPLLYWVSAASFKLMGREDRWAARLPLALAALLTCALLAWTARRRLGEEAAFWAAAAYGSCLYAFLLSDVLITDGLLTLGVATAFAALDWGRDEGWGQGRKGWGPPLLLGLGLGIGVLAKGPVGAVLPCLGLGLECLLARGLGPVREIRRPIPALLTALAVALPWFVLEERAVPGFLHFFIVDQHLLRYATDEARRQGPFWMFAVIALGGWFPWWGALWDGIRQGWGDPGAGSFLRRSLAWAAAIVLFFSFSRSKLPPYVWPAFPLLAFPVGWGCARIAAGEDRRVWRGWLGVSLLLGLALALFSLSPRFYRNFQAMAPAGVAAGIGMAALCAAALALGRRGLPVLAAGALLVWAGIFGQAGRLDTLKSCRDLAGRILQDDPREEGLIVNHRGFRPSLAFYSGRRIVQWGSPGELAFGMNLLPPAERDQWFFDTKGRNAGEQAAKQAVANARMQALWSGPRKAYLVVRAKDVGNAGALPLVPPGREFCRVGEDAVLVNR